MEAIDSKITLNGDDWNIEKHYKFDKIPTLEDFKKTVYEYMSWEFKTYMKEKGYYGWD